jgi:CcmD family protein
LDSGLYYLFLAYTVLWVINFGYMLFLGKRYSDAKKEIEHLEKMISGK